MIDYDRAACVGYPTEIFFPDPRTAKAARQTKTALEICSTCPIIKQCREEIRRLEKGTNIYHRYGIWAGTTPAQRLIEDKETQP